MWDGAALNASVPSSWQHSSTVGFVFARGGSKGVPGKNLRPLEGVPPIARSIRIALASKYIGAVVVSTDDEEIAEVALREGAFVPALRPEELATDNASAWLTAPSLSDAVEPGMHNAGKPLVDVNILKSSIVANTSTQVSTAIVDATTKAAAEHPKLKKAFAKTTGPKLEAFKKNMNDFLCEQMKGPCKYEGKDMRAAHKGMGATEAQWEAFVEVFVKALTDGGVGEAERDEILDLITPLHDEVLNKKK